MRNQGNVRRTYTCGLCERTFRADKRTADKLIRLHYKKTHNQTFDANDTINSHVLSHFQRDQENVHTIYKVLSANANYENP